MVPDPLQMERNHSNLVEVGLHSVYMSIMVFLAFSIFLATAYFQELKIYFSNLSVLPNSEKWSKVSDWSNGSTFSFTSFEGNLQVLQVNSIQWHWVQSPQAFAFNWILPMIMMSISNTQPSCSQTNGNSNWGFWYKIQSYNWTLLWRKSHQGQNMNLVTSIWQYSDIFVLTLVANWYSYFLPMSYWMCPCKSTHFVPTLLSGSLLLICTSLLTLLTSCHCGCVCEVNPG